MKLVKYFEDTKNLHVGTTPNRSYYIPCYNTDVPKERRQAA